MKKHLIEHKTYIPMLIMGKRFIAPKKTVQAIFTLILSNPEIIEEELIPYHKMIEKKLENSSKGALALQGARARDDVSQKQLAQKVGIDEDTLIRMENGKEKITPKFARQFGKIFNIYYKVFLE